VQMVARLNATVGYTAFAITAGPKTTMTGRQGGTGGKCEVLSQSTQVGTAMNYSISSASGAGNVANIGAVTTAEVSSLTIAAAGGATPAFVVSVTRDQNNALCINYTGSPGAGTLTVVSCSAAALGFTAGQVANAAPGVNGFIPAGTRVRTAGGAEWVTMQTVPVTSTNAGPYTIKIRPALDNTLAVGTGAGTVVVVADSVVGLGTWACTNALPIAAALTDAQIDAAYVTAIDSTKNLSSIVKQTNIIVSARQSNAIRNALRSNVIDASSNGCFGRMAVIRPPLGTTRVRAKGTAAQPGVGTYRHQRVVYAFPGVQISVSQIAAVGTAGGAGFTASGLIDVGSDTWVASVMSNLNPEENPGQSQDFMSSVLGLEAANTDVRNMVMTDYKSLKAAGIAVPRMESGLCIIQSGVTSVDPAVSPSLVNINRQRYADFLTDTLSQRLNAFVKQLASRSRRALIMGEMDAFMHTQIDPTQQRCDGYLLDGKSGNTPETLAAGLFRIILRVRMTPSMDSIVLDTQVGTSVVVTQLSA
jgi:hypothetical protein